MKFETFVASPNGWYLRDLRDSTMDQSNLRIFSESSRCRVCHIVYFGWRAMTRSWSICQLHELGEDIFAFFPLFYILFSELNDGRSPDCAERVHRAGTACKGWMHRGESSERAIVEFAGVSQKIDHLVWRQPSLTVDLEKVTVKNKTELKGPQIVIGTVNRGRDCHIARSVGGYRRWSQDWLERIFIQQEHRGDITKVVKRTRDGDAKWAWWGSQFWGVQNLDLKGIQSRL
jgi:hypothetical protein